MKKIIPTLVILSILSPTLAFASPQMNCLSSGLTGGSIGVIVSITPNFTTELLVTKNGIQSQQFEDVKVHFANGPVSYQAGSTVLQLVDARPQNIRQVEDIGGIRTFRYDTVWNFKTKSASYILICTRDGSDD